VNVQLTFGHASKQLDPHNSRVFIGRDQSYCGLLTDHGSVSRRHAEVWVENGQVYIRDLGSSNGTWVNGSAVGAHPVVLQPGQQIYVGYVPLGVTWQGPQGGATVMAQEMPAELRALMEQRKQQAQSHQSTVPANPSAQMQVPGAPQGFTGGNHSGVPQSLNYRRQGANNNGCLLIALPGDSFTNGQVIDGFVEFTATDAETVSSITVELVENHKKGPRGGHVWDSVLVRQGPWKNKRGDVLPMPFQLRVPGGTSVSGRDVHWEVKGYVDIAWAWDIEAVSPVTMRNLDVERVRDALGSLDYRIVDQESAPLGQKHKMTFQPPAQLQSTMGIRQIWMEMEYLGQNLKMTLKVDKQKRFVKDPEIEFTVDLGRFRASQLHEVAQHVGQQIQHMMA
jgi:hypothetical protein